MAYSTDTRSICEGDTYVAIRGDRYDGHDFVQDAFRKGAIRAVVETRIEGVNPNQLDIVPNAILYLAQIASKNVRQSGAQVIAITGSVGKTTTRNAVTEVLQMAGPVVSSVGNLNTLLGLSLTLANRHFDSNSRLVLEMGASQKGDLSEICQYYTPDISIITNVRGVHLEMLGSIQGVEREKSELVRALSPTGIACLNADDELTRAMVSVCKGQHIFYGMSTDAHIQPHNITATVSLLGDHVIYILMAAYAAGIAVGIDPVTINQGLSRIKPEKGRLNQLPARAGASLIDDSYNASPAAVKLALDVLSKSSAQRRVVFLGDMLELGDREEEDHQYILKMAAKVSDYIIGCGPRMEKASMTLRSELGYEIQCFPESMELASELSHGRVYSPQPGDVILVKGSQGARMERVSRALLSEEISAESVLARQTEAWLSI
ncbi:MAG: UDP-N-acetylmuramoyl-tripeptide--D-alanyl-D-alanine ligase [Bacteroidetes bacterium]|nr:UDP-N-acetylmuramoyl-tripeptide--D-alanyl-D-alanine ligase [Bacteroidota bacterium]MCY4232475.1 UDP-N-acetylmuramoyl-tripeptide--D-alanyl-D-alanine ligase [Bacteroidota bacterium]